MIGFRIIYGPFEINDGGLCIFGGAKTENDRASKPTSAPIEQCSCKQKRPFEERLSKKDSIILQYYYSKYESNVRQ